MESFIGTIQPFAFNFAPQSWSTCQGQVVSIAQNSAMFSLLGTMFGGNGQTTFQLPDLQGRVPMGMGNGPGLTPRIEGEASGVENITLLTSNMPTHTHPATLTGGTSVAVQVSTNTANNTTAPSETNSYLSASNPTGQGQAAIWSSTMTAPVALGGVSVNQNSSVSIGLAGQGMPFSIMNPFLVLNFCIAMMGIFPTRN